MDYSFWENEVNSLSAIVSNIPPDFPICVTGIPSTERLGIVQYVLNAKNLKYCLYSCSMRATSKDILSVFCSFIYKELGSVFAQKSMGELLMDIHDGCEQYWEKSEKRDCFYLVLDRCENMKEEDYELICKLTMKVPAMGLIVTVVSVNDFVPNTSFILHLPVLSDEKMEQILLWDLQDSLDEFSKHITHQIILHFGSYTHSLSELRTIRDLVLHDCMEHHCTTIQEGVACFESIKQSLLVNIHSIWDERRESIPLCDYCGVDISLNAKILLVAAYLCSIYQETEDSKLFGREDGLSVKTKGRKKRKHVAPMKSGKSIVFSLQRLLALYCALKAVLFPDSRSTSSNYGFLLSQLNVLLRLGLIAQMTSSTRFIEIDQVLYRCCVSKTSILNIAKNIGFEISPYV